MMTDEAVLRQHDFLLDSHIYRGNAYLCFNFGTPKDLKFSDR